jgi:hypothetical protein
LTVIFELSKPNPTVPLTVGDGHRTFCFVCVFVSQSIGKVASYSITSSARAMSVSGTLKPSAESTSVFWIPPKLDEETRCQVASPHTCGEAVEELRRFTLPKGVAV